MKNTVYALAAEHPVDEPETFGALLARHFIDRNPRLSACPGRVSRALLGADSHAAAASTAMPSSVRERKCAPRRVIADRKR